MKMALQLAKAASFVLVCCILGAAQSPQVHLDADELSPRSIEALTQSAIERDYAQAWRTMATALELNRTDALAEEFVGFAKDRLKRRITDQQTTGVHVRIVDRGHQLKALFYSSDGASMQLIDNAQLEIQTLDGSRVIDTQASTHHYMILMTPGADRWYVRDLEEIPATPTERSQDAVPAGGTSHRNVSGHRG